MDLSRSKFINDANVIIPRSFDGSAPGLASFVDALELLETVTAAEQHGLAVKFLKTRLTGMVRDLITDKRSKSKIIKTVKCGVKIPKLDTIISRMKRLSCSSDVSKYFEVLETLAEKLLCSYLNIGIPFESAESLVVDQVKEILGENATCQCIFVKLNCKQFQDAKEVTTDYLACLLDDHRNCRAVSQKPRFHQQQSRYRDPQLQHRPIRPQRHQHQRQRPRHQHSRLRPHHQP